MNDYGEPWNRDGNFSYNRHGIQIIPACGCVACIQRLDRINASVNALAGLDQATLEALRPGDVILLRKSLDNCVKLLEPDLCLEDIHYREKHGARMIQEAKILLERLP